MVLILILALGLRIGWVLTRPTTSASLEQLPDQQEYLAVAQSLRNGDGLSFIDPRFDDRVYAFRTPGFPAFLATFDGDIRAIRVAQCLLDASAVFAAFLLACLWLDRRMALLAALIVAINPFLIYFCGLILTETLFTTMLIWGMYCLTHRATIAWIAGGVLLACAILVRPAGIALPVLMGILAAFVNPATGTPYQRRWRLPVGTTMLLLTLLVLFPWAFRNERILGRWIWTSTNAGITAYDGFNPDASGDSDQRFIDRMPQLRSMSEIQRDDYLAAKASTFVRRNPRQVVDLAGIKAARTWSPVPLSRQFSRPLYIAVGLCFAVPIDLLILIGLCGKKLPARVKLFLVAPALYLTLCAALSVGSLRYRIPADVPLAILAAGGIAGVMEKFKRTAILAADANT